MTNNENITIRFSADISDLKSGISQANSDIKLANAQFKAASAGMDDWSKSSDGIKAKLSQLGATLNAEKTKLNAYKEQLERIQDAEKKNVKSAEDLRAKYQQAAATYGENSAEAQKYKKQLATVEKEIVSNQKAQEQLGVTILNQQAKVSKTEKEYKNFESRLGQVEKAEKEAEKSGRDVVDVLAKMDKEAENAEEGMENLDGGFTVLKGSIANLVSSGIQSLVSGFQNLMESTQETRLELGKVETAFTTAGFSAETASKTYKDFYGILGDQGQATEAVNHLAKLAKTEEELATWTNIATGVYATFGDSLPIENLTEAANETAKTGAITGGLADALNWAGISEDSFQESLDSCTSEQERQKLIMDTLNKTYDEASTKYKEVNGDIIESNKAQAELSDIMASVGEKVAPITTALQEGFAKILTKILELIGEGNIEQWANDISKAFEGFINNVLPAIETGLKWIIDNKDFLIASIVGIGAAFGAFKVVTLIQGVITALKGMSLAQAAVTAAQWLMNVAMSANPIGLIIAAIAGLVAAFLWLWNNCEGFRNFWIGLWESIMAFTKAIWDVIVKLFKAAWDGIVKIWDAAKPFFQAIWDGIKLIFSVVVEWFINKFKAAWDGIVKIWNAVTGFFRGIWDGIKLIFSVVAEWFINKFKAAWDGIVKIWNAVTGFFRGIWQGITSIFSSASSWFGNIFSSAVNAIKNAWNNITGFFRGIWGGIQNVFGSVSSWFGNVFSSAVNAIKAPINWVIDGINQMIGGLNSIKFTVPDWVPGIGGRTIGFNIGKLPRLARGGVLKKGQVGLLEGSGAEAVVPLEKNKEWLQKVAVELANNLRGAGSNSSASSDFNSGNTINFYQTNNSPKSLSRLEIYRQTKNALRYAAR